MAQPDSSKIPTTGRVDADGGSFGNARPSAEKTRGNMLRDVQRGDQVLIDYRSGSAPPLPGAVPFTPGKR